MRRTILSGIITLSFFITYAQQTPSRSSKLSFSLNGGVAIPGGNFSKGDYADEKSGFVKSGSHFNITGMYYLNKNFGIAALVGYSQFGHKGSVSLAEGYKEDSGTDSTTLYTKGVNSSLSLLAGPYYTIPVSKKFSIDLRVLGGYVNTRLSGFQIFYEDYTGNAMMQKKSSGGSFGFQAGAALKYHVTDRLFVKANTDYFSSKPKISISYDNFIVNSGRKLDTYNEAINGVTATVGIGISLF